MCACHSPLRMPRTPGPSSDAVNEDRPAGRRTRDVAMVGDQRITGPWMAIEPACNASHPRLGLKALVGEEPLVSHGDSEPDTRNMEMNSVTSRGPAPSPTSSTPRRSSQDRRMSLSYGRFWSRAARASNTRIRAHPAHRLGGVRSRTVLTSISPSTVT